jgi:hypothetical protein
MPMPCFLVAATASPLLFAQFAFGANACMQLGPSPCYLYSARCLEFWKGQRGHECCITASVSWDWNGTTSPQIRAKFSSILRARRLQFGTMNKCSVEPCVRVDAHAWSRVTCMLPQCWCRWVLERPTMRSYFLPGVVPVAVVAQCLTQIVPRTTGLVV